MTIEELSKKRLAICRQCPLYKEDSWGPVCNPKRYLNPETGEVSFFPKEGYVKGCNCRLGQKTKNPSNHCIANK